MGELENGEHYSVVCGIKKIENKHGMKKAENQCSRICYIIL